MQVRHILQGKGREIISIGGDATLSEAALLLSSHRIGAVVVHGEGGQLVGILSERDVVSAIAQQSVRALALPVSHFMTRNVYCCTEDDMVDSLMEVMTAQRFRHIPVMENDRLIGIVSIGDVVKTRIEETVREATVLREYIATG